MKQKQTDNKKQKSVSKSSKTKKRIFIFNIDPQNDEITSSFLSKKNRDLLVKHQNDVVYVFLTKFSLNIVLKLFEKSLKLKTGYIISSNGSCLYSIANKSILFSLPLTYTAKSFLIHEAMLKSLLIVSSSKTKSYCYSEDIKKFVRLKSAFITDILLIQNYLTYQHFIYENEFLNFVFYDTDINILIEKYKKIKLLEDDLDFYISPIENNTFSVSSIESLPINAYYKVLEDLNCQIDNTKTYYFVLNSFDKTIWNAFSKNHYLNIQYLIDNKNLFDAQFTTQNIFLPKNIIDIFSNLISRSASIQTHLIVGDEKKLINLINKKTKR